MFYTCIYTYKLYMYIPLYYTYIYLYTIGDARPHHKSNFDFDENALLISSSVLVQIARDLLA